MFKSWALSAMAAAVITAVINFLSPNGAFEKSIKIITAVFMLICFAAPIADGSDYIDISGSISGVDDWINDSALESEVKKQVSQTLKDEIETKITSFLKGKAVEEFEIETKIDIDGNENIKIDSISIFLTDETHAEALKDYIYNNFNIMPQVIVKTEEKNE